MGTLIIDKNANFLSKSVAKYYPQMDAIVKNQDGFTKYCIATDQNVNASVHDINKTISSYSCRIKYTGLIGNKVSGGIMPIVFHLKDYSDNNNLSIDVYKNADTNELCVRTINNRAWKTFNSGYNIGTNSFVVDGQKISGGKLVYLDIETSFDGNTFSIVSFNVNGEECELTALSSGTSSSAGTSDRVISFNDIIGQTNAYFCFCVLIGMSIKSNDVQGLLLDIEGETNEMKFKDKVSGGSLEWSNSNPKLYKTSFTYN